MPPRLGTGLPWLGLWVILIAIALWTRPLWPMVEVRFAAVAWDMWLHDSFLVPQLNGEVYSHKPPLLYWLVHLGWFVFGVSETWLRLVAPLFGLASVVMTYRLGRELWPERPDAASMSAVILVGSFLFIFVITLTMFDVLVVFFTLLALMAIGRVWRSGRLWGWGLYGVALGLGMLAKGPVILAFTVPVALLAPWWSAGDAPEIGRRWYLGLLGGGVLGVAIALLWALPAAAAGGPLYAEAILWGQISGRVVESFAHARPFWWYVVALPVATLPWLAWPRVWRAAARASLWRDPGVKFCLAWFVPAFLILSLISGKQPFYLLPLFPALALIAGYALINEKTRAGRDGLVPGVIFALLGLLAIAAAGWLAVDADRAVSRHLPAWVLEVSVVPGLVLLVTGLVIAVAKFRTPAAVARSLALQMVLLILLGHLFVVRPAAADYDLRPLALYFAGLERQEYPLAQISKYHGQYHFLGRLREPLAILAREGLQQWFVENPDGRVITYHREPPKTDAGPEIAKRFRSRYIAVWDRTQVLANPDLFTP